MAHGVNRCPCDARHHQNAKHGRGHSLPQVSLLLRCQMRLLEFFPSLVHVHGLGQASLAATGTGGLGEAAIELTRLVVMVNGIHDFLFAVTLGMIKH